MTTMLGQFAVCPLKWHFYLGVCSINLHDTYLNTQLGTINFDMNIIKIETERHLTCEEADKTKSTIDTFMF